MTPVVKAGKLANGAERGKGRIIHLVDSDHPYLEPALCGEVPKIQWSTIEDNRVSCSKCVIKMLETTNAEEV